MNQKELKELIDYLIDKDIAEFELERGDVKLRIKRGSAASPPAVETHYIAVPPAGVAAGAVVAPVTTPVAPAPVAPASEPSPAPAGAAPTEPMEALHTVRSPIVGTFYESASPGAPPFVNVGDSVQAGQVLCIIEAMKLMNEIEADVAGEIVARHVSNAQPVEFGQPLFDIRPRK